MLDEAKASLEKIISVLGPQIESGVPIVVLEPGCHSVFKDELLKLLPGSFGFRPETYEASVRIANLQLLPKVKQAGAESIIVANGFSCREQIEGLGGRETLHLAEVLARAID